MLKIFVDNNVNKWIGSNGLFLVYHIHGSEQANTRQKNVTHSTKNSFDKKITVKYDTYSKYRYRQDKYCKLIIKYDIIGK